MRKNYLLILLITACCLCYHTMLAQIDSASIRMPQLVAMQNNQNLLSKALDGAVYLVRQEYVLETPSGKQQGRGIMNYFGKSYRIGLLVERDLWMPSSIRTPWKEDPNYQENKSEYEAVCSLTKVKKINGKDDYRSFDIKNLNLEQALTSFKPGIAGLQTNDSLPPYGKLQIYYVDSDQSPDEAEIKSTTVQLKQIIWNPEGIAEIEKVTFKDRTILGGALFIESVSLGKIDIELVAIYADQKGDWILQAVAPLIEQNHPNN